MPFVPLFTCGDYNIINAVPVEADSGGDLRGQVVCDSLHLEALRAAPRPLQRPLDLLVRAGQIEIPGGCALWPGVDADHHRGRFVAIRWEVPPIIELLQFHPVVVYYTVGGDHPGASRFCFILVEWETKSKPSEAGSIWGGGAVE